MNLKDKQFIGYIVADGKVDEHWKSGRYFVHINELMPYISPAEGILCWNSITNLQVIDTARKDIIEEPIATHGGTLYGHVIHRKIAKDPTSGTLKQGMTGSYSPLLPSVKYVVKFMDNDINSGHIIAPYPYDLESKVQVNYDSKDELSPFFKSEE